MAKKGVAKPAKIGMPGKNEMVPPKIKAGLAKKGGKKRY